MKKTVLVSLGIGVFLSGASAFAMQDIGGMITLDGKAQVNTSAQSPSGSVLVRDDVNVPLFSDTEVVSSSNENSLIIRETALPRIVSKGNALIDERLMSLKKASSSIALSKTLTIDQKNTLLATIATNSNGLLALKTSIASSKDATSTKALIASVYTNFRIYGIVLPQLSLEKRIYNFQNHTLKLSDTFVKIQAKIDAYKAQGRDVSVWQKNLDDAKIIVATDMNTLANLFIKVSVLKPADYGTTSKQVFSESNTSLKLIAQDFTSIAKKLATTKLLKLQKMTVAASSSVMVR